MSLIISKWNGLMAYQECVLWEAGKAVMWGKEISFSSHRKKEQNSKVSELEIKIQLLEDAYVAFPDEHILNRIRKAKLELNEITDKTTSTKTYTPHKLTH